MGDEGAALNFESATLENATEGATRAFNFANDLIFPGFAVLCFILSVLFLILWARRQASRPLPSSILIPNWPVGLKVALFPLLISYALTHAFSLGSVYFNTKVFNPSTEVYFQNLGVGRLFSLSHAHLFAHATMYFLLAALVQFSGRSKLFTLYAPLIALWAGVFDVFSWWGTKKLSPNFEILSALSGSAFSIGFLLMAFAILASVFLRTDND